MGCRKEASIAGAMVAFDGLDFATAIEVWDVVVHRLYGARADHVINREQLRLLQEIHAVVTRPRPTYDDMFAGERLPDWVKRERKA